MDYFSLDSKATFLSSCVVPVNDNDAFHDDKCAFCWGKYDDDHPAARILPCNHCFGRDCIQQFADAPSGDLCPICRTPLFRPPIVAAAERCFIMVWAIIVEYILLAQHQVLVFHAKLPPWGKVASEVIYARYTSQSIPYWIGKLIDSSTALPAHISKPDLCYQLQILSMKHWFGIQVCYCIRFGVALLGPILHEIRQPELDTGRDITQLLIEPGVDFGMKSTRYHVYVSVFMLIWTMYFTFEIWRATVKGGTNTVSGVVQGPLLKRRDRAMVGLVVLTAALLLCVWDLWVVLCFYRSHGVLETWTGYMLRLCFRR